MTLKKLFLFALVIAILIPAVSSATSSRYMGLGGPGTNFIVYDASNPGIYPSLTPKWPKLLGIEYSGTGSAWNHTLAYCVWDFEGGSAVKFVLDSSPASIFDVTGAGLFSGVDFDPNNQGINANFHMLGLYYGRPLGEDLDFGLGLRYEGKSFTSDEVPGQFDETDISYSSFGFTAGITALEKNLDAALGVDFASFSREVASVTAMENDGSMRFSLQGRYWYHYSETNTLVPHLRFVNKKFAYTEPNDVAQTSTTTDIQLGLGHNWTPVEACLIIFELGFQSYTCEDEYESGGSTSTMTESKGDIYWRLGGETRITNWLKGRLGAVRMWRGATDEIDTGSNTYEQTYGYSTTSIYAGGTFHYKRLFIDFLVQPDFFKYGPAFIGGDNPSGTGLTSKVSMFYNFGKD